MGGGKRPKRYAATVKRYAAGIGVKADQRLADAIFLSRHSGWTWRDLQETPSDIVALMRMIDAEESRITKVRSEKQGIQVGK